MNQSRKRLIAVIISGILLLLTFTFVGFIEFGHIFGDNALLSNLFIGLAFVLTALFALSLFFFVSNRSIVRTLRAENEYNLGVRNEFNNIYSFQRRLAAISRFRKAKKKPHYIVAFTFSSLAVSQNVNRNKEIYEMNSHIAKFLEQLPTLIGSKKRDFIYGFSRGSFLIHCFEKNENAVQNMCEVLSREIYRFGENNCRHIWVQPFYGATLVNKDDSLLHQIENAFLARDYSERNFETITFYRDSFRRSVADNEVEELMRALENKEFVVYYQPKFDLANKRFISSEALIRWKSAKYGLLAPTKFLTKAESIGLIHDIDVYVLRQVCEDLNDLIRRGRRALPVSVNFSLFEFYNANFLDTIMGILNEFKVPPHLIEIEITEATSQANQFLSISIIKKLKENGIRVLMDDFGVGFSNVGNLQKIPFDVVKIDKSFIDGIVSDTKSREIVRFLIGLCKINGMEVVAEGVDNKEQVEILKKAHCDTIQGFYYSEALEKKAFEKFLENNPFEKKEGAKL